MSSQESSGSTSSKLNLSLSQETVDYMWHSVSDIADPTVCDFTKIYPRDLSMKKEDMQDIKEDVDQCYDLTTTSRSRNDESSTNIHQQSTGTGTVNSVSLPSLPSTCTYSGEYDFKVSLSVQSKETKAADWIYSEKLQKVFIRFDAPCPFLFSTSHDTPCGCVIRAMPTFVRPQHRHEVVRRCPHHASMLTTTNAGDGVPPVDHLIRCDHKLAKYHEHPVTGFHSVIVPYDIPPADVMWMSYLYQFTCFSSCAGGLNRRPFQVIFTLEDCSGQVLGRNTVEVRICACPGRDRQIEEKNSASAQTPKPPMPISAKPAAVSAGYSSDGPTAKRHSSDGPASKRQRLNDVAGDVFTLSVCGRENFTLLRQMRDALEVSSALPHSQYQQVHSQQQSRRKSHPDLAPSQVTALSSALKLNGVTLPLDTVKEQLSAEQAHSTYNGTLSTGIGDVQSAPKRKHSCEDRIESWLMQHQLSSFFESFNKVDLIFMKQLNLFKLADFERLGLSEDDLAKVWLAFSRLQRHVDDADQTTLNGDDVP